MKTLTHAVVILVLVCNQVKSQNFIPNRGFENWTSTGEFEEPNDWVTSNIFTVAFSDSVSVEKSTDKVEGTYSIHLKSRVYRDSFSSMSYGAFAACTKIQHLFGGGIPGFAYNQRPIKLKGFLKANSSPVDTSSITVGLTKYDDIEQMSEFIALGRMFITDTIGEFIPFEITLQYIDSSMSAPDTAVIFMNSTGDSIANGGDLWIDQLSFELGVGVSTIERLPMKLSNLENAWKLTMDETLNVNYWLYTLSGQQIMHRSIKSIDPVEGVLIDHSKFSKGAYVLIVESGGITNGLKVVK